MTAFSFFHFPFLYKIFIFFIFILYIFSYIWHHRSSVGAPPPHMYMFLYFKYIFILSYRDCFISPIRSWGPNPTLAALTYPIEVASYTRGPCFAVHRLRRILSYVYLLSYRICHSFYRLFYRLGFTDLFKLFFSFSKRGSDRCHPGYFWKTFFYFLFFYFWGLLLVS